MHLLALHLSRGTTYASANVDVILNARVTTSFFFLLDDACWCCIKCIPQLFISLANRCMLVLMLVPYQTQESRLLSPLHSTMHAGASAAPGASLSSSSLSRNDACWCHTRRTSYDFFPLSTRQCNAGVSAAPGAPALSMYPGLLRKLALVRVTGLMC